MLYAALFDRMMLSSVNHWRDEFGRVYVIFSNRSLCELFHWSHDKVSRMMGKLEEFGLIERRKRGQGRADHIYVLPISELCDYSDTSDEENLNSSRQKACSLEVLNYAANETDIKETESNETISSLQDLTEEEILEIIHENIEYDVLAGHKVDKASLDELVTLMVDTCLGRNPTVKIGGDIYSRERVINRLLSLNAEHMEYVLDQLREGKSEVKNFRAYAQTALFNAPTTMEMETDRRIHQLIG